MGKEQSWDGDTGIYSSQAGGVAGGIRLVVRSTMAGGGGFDGN